MLDDCGIETTTTPRCSGCGIRSRSMLDDCGIETWSCRFRVRVVIGRDRCSMAVGSRRLARASHLRHGSRSMLDGCGIETSVLSWRLGVQAVAIDARWLWDRDGRVSALGRASSPRSRSMLDGCGIETVHDKLRRRSSRWSRSMLDVCGIETLRTSERQSSSPGRDRCSMAVGSRRHVAHASLAELEAGRDRCSIAVGSRHDASQRPMLVSPSRSMLDGCGIETTSWRNSLANSRRSRSMLDSCGIETLSTERNADARLAVAIDARWLWDRDDVVAQPLANSRRSRSMLDGCGIETLSDNRRRQCSYRVAIDARWLWDRDDVVADVARELEAVAIDARWLWDRDTATAASSATAVRRSRSMLDGCGIETTAAQRGRSCRSRSMLDGCGIETCRTLHDSELAARRDRCSMAVGSRRRVPARASPARRGRDRCSMAVGSRP